MPTYTAITLDRLLEPGVSKSMAAAKEAPDSKLGRRNSTPIPKLDSGMSAPNSKLGRRNSTSTVTTIDKKHHWARISPALYATPESTPLPDSPSSFPPSPYIINHKRRGPRLLKSFSEDDVATRQRALGEEKVVENAKKAEEEVADLAKDVTSTVTVPSPVEEEEHMNGIYDGGLGSGEMTNGQVEQNSSAKSVTFNLEREGEVKDFFDHQELMSVKSNTEGESNSGVDRSLNLTTPMAEFFDAWEELSSESGPQPSLCDVEAELREIRLSLLMEIEKRKQAEEALNNMRSQWLRIQQQFSLVGLILPADLIAVAEDEQVDVDPIEELCQQVYLARFVSNSIGRGIAKAEVEMEMEAQIELKNFEITRLWDRLQYYEAVNREMSHRNQEAIEMARRLRQRRKRKQRWVWGSIAAVISLGTAVLVWSYLPTGKGSSSTNQSVAPECDQAAN
uniref:Netrin receptor DCC n=1 Tax=Davidia involucrata TaxID=16924 RepID=A0A5B6YW29_DAVIN